MRGSRLRAKRCSDYRGAAVASKFFEIAPQFESMKIFRKE
jgi:hypothetical protein